MRDVNERLVKEDRHYVKLNSGRMIEVRDEGGRGSELEYQRVCVGTEDGGVISLDWPSNLDLKEEYGLDTTVLLVPGTAEGSMEEDVRAFVLEALRRGLFPVVMNPRGCAGSPLTTPRLFTAADSDDIATAIQFINKARPWTTLMAIGWGFGANMLTKHLAEVGENTSLTAATCIDNPFDLEEVTRSTPYHVALDQKLVGGLKDILRSNKELFQGRTKQFDVEKALSAKSVRDFEKAISMVSYGFEAIEDFYSESSTRSMVRDVKIPILFMQNDDGAVPLFSIPRGLIAENPFTSLLLCSCSLSKDAVTWYQQFTIEWLAAVELGLLKGRHPLLNNLDVTINPSTGLAIADVDSTDKGGEHQKLLDITRLNAGNGYCMDPAMEMLEDADTAVSTYPLSRLSSLGNKSSQGVKDGMRHDNSIEADLVKEEAVPMDSERSQMLQTAKVVMNMLDVTMPGTLKEEEKKKVFDAVGKGETVMKALQDAVPEDVRGKLTASLSGIMLAQGDSIRQGIESIPNISIGLKSKIQEKISSSYSGDEIQKSDDSAHSNSQEDMDKTNGGIGSQVSPSENSQKFDDGGHPQPNTPEGDHHNTVRNPSDGPINTHENEAVIKEKSAAHSELGDLGSDTSTEPDFTGQPERAGNAYEEISDENKADQDGGVTPPEIKDENTTQKEEKILDSPTNQNIVTAESFSEASVEGQENDNQKKESSNIEQNTPPSSDSNSSSFSVSQALDALSGMDDTTQMAVNSVYGVIENVISQLEEGKVDENESEDRNKTEYENDDSEALEIIEDGRDDIESAKEEGIENDQNTKSDESYYPTKIILPEKALDLQYHAGREWVKEPLKYSISANVYDRELSNSAKRLEIEEKNRLAKDKLATDYSDRPVSNFPVHIRESPAGDFLRNESFGRYLLSKQNAEALDLNTTTALLLDYIPEEGQWMLLEQPGSSDSTPDIITPNGISQQLKDLPAIKVNETDKTIEPSYVILDANRQNKPVEEYGTMGNTDASSQNVDRRSEELMQFVKKIVLDSLRVEVGRRFSISDMKEMKYQLDRDLDKVAIAVSLAVKHEMESTNLQGKPWNISISEKIATICGKEIIRAISSAVQETSYLRRVLPIGLIIGSSLAGLRNSFNLSTIHDECEREVTVTDKIKDHGKKDYEKTTVEEIEQKPARKTVKEGSLHGSDYKERINTGLGNMTNDGVMVGAVTAAALGASAWLGHNEDSLQGDGTAETLSKAFKEKGNQQKDPYKPEEAMSEGQHNNIVASFAEKAMSVAGPVVPTKEGGEVDQDRLVSMLTELGQKGGLLRLFGKVALLWGGIRGAMSLTDKLITFLRLAERPLFQRILGFVTLVLVLWSPVVVPLLPTLMQCWTTSNHSKVAEFVCIVGLYIAVLILVNIWGKRVRGYENPFEHYGLDLTSPSKIQNLLKGFIGGVMLIVLIQSVNAVIGCATFSGPPSLLSSSSNAVTLFKVCGKLFIMAVQGLITATGIVFIEELLFRSWLPEEITPDLGYHEGIFLSGIAFSLFQRSIQAIPGLWLLSLALSGIRERSKGSLSIPIGFRAGLVASCYILQRGGFVVYKSSFPLWVTGTRPFEPFSGVVGLAFSFLLAITLYPRERKISYKTVQE